jgi:uncharacterized membrane protein HdeD (DUF308 family)
MRQREKKKKKETRLSHHWWNAMWLGLIFLFVGLLRRFDPMHTHRHARALIRNSNSSIATSRKDLNQVT